METVKTISLIALSICIVMAILNAHMLDGKFHAWRIKMKNRRSGWDVQHIVENARRRSK